MNHFAYRDGELCCEDVPLRRIAQEVGTPTYVYSSATILRHYGVFADGLRTVPHLICYSVKACSNLAVLRLLANEGAGFDVVSGGELHRVLSAGITAERVVFSGVGKRRDEMEMALHAGIRAFNVESEAELEVLSEVAVALGAEARVSLRVNPDVDPGTHPYIATGLRESKFGIPWDRAVDAYERARVLPGLRVVGADCHIGSQLTSLAPLLAALERMLELIGELRTRGHVIEDLDLGGGLGIPYGGEDPPHPRDLTREVVARTAGQGLTLLFEPGRVIVGNAGVLLMRVLYLKDSGAKRFVVVDAAMNDAIRPALYQAHHDLRPVAEPSRDATELVDVVGPICESGDFFARNRALPPLAAEDLVVLASAGAYGFSMASNYNSRGRAAEVLVAGDRFDVVRRRESLADLIRGEAVPEYLVSN